MLHLHFSGQVIGGHWRGRLFTAVNRVPERCVGDLTYTAGLAGWIVLSAAEIEAISRSVPSAGVCVRLTDGPPDPKSGATE